MTRRTQRLFCSCVLMCVLVLMLLQSCPTLCDPHGRSPPGSSVRGILQARILGWVSMSSSRGYSWPRDQTCVSCLLHWQTDSLPLNHLSKSVMVYYSESAQIKLAKGKCVGDRVWEKSSTGFQLSLKQHWISALWCCLWSIFSFLHNSLQDVTEHSQVVGYEREGTAISWLFCIHVLTLLPTWLESSPLYLAKFHSVLSCLKFSFSVVFVTQWFLLSIFCGILMQVLIPFDMLSLVVLIIISHSFPSSYFSFYDNNHIIDS